VRKYIVCVAAVCLGGAVVVDDDDVGIVMQRERERERECACVRLCLFVRHKKEESLTRCKYKQRYCMLRKENYLEDGVKNFVSAVAAGFEVFDAHHEEPDEPEHCQRFHRACFDAIHIQT
jgi:hypothetical protein